MRTGKRHKHKLTSPPFAWTPSDAALLKLIKDLKNSTNQQPKEQVK